ncbi:MAG: nucleotidyltransferase family protein [Clostridia bacterium]|nr:nucleotidyltransferase family protein [Clostridia bacterium]
MINAVVLAGDGKKLVIGDKEIYKSFLNIHGKIMIEYVIDALVESEMIDKIVVVGPREQLSNYIDSKVDCIVDDRGSIIENAKAGVEQFEDNKRILIITSDIPMVTAEAIDDFVKRAYESGGDFCYPIVDKRLNDQKYPGVRRTYVKLKEGTFTGGNFIMIEPRVLEKCEDIAKKLIAFRKKPWKATQIIGVQFLIQLIIGTLSLPKLEERFSEIMGIKAVAIISDYPEIGNDVDKPSDVEMAMQYIKDVNVTA